jgi:hypothetical protein
MDNEQHIIHKYELVTGKDNETDSFVLGLDPYHTHFHFFDDGNDTTNNIQNVLLKRQEIEHELNISKALISPVVGYQPKSTSMCCRY